MRANRISTASPHQSWGEVGPVTSLTGRVSSSCPEAPRGDRGRAPIENLAATTGVDLEHGDLRDPYSRRIAMSHEPNHRDGRE